MVFKYASFRSRPAAPCQPVDGAESHRAHIAYKTLHQQRFDWSFARSPWQWCRITPQAYILSCNCQLGLCRFRSETNKPSGDPIKSVKDWFISSSMTWLRLGMFCVIGPRTTEVWYVLCPTPYPIVNGICCCCCQGLAHRLSSGHRLHPYIIRAVFEIEDTVRRLHVLGHQLRLAHEDALALHGGDAEHAVVVFGHASPHRLDRPAHEPDGSDP